MDFFRTLILFVSFPGIVSDKLLLLPQESVIIVVFALETLLESDLCHSWNQCCCLSNSLWVFYREHLYLCDPWKSGYLLLRPVDKVYWSWDRWGLCGSGFSMRPFMSFAFLMWCLSDGLELLPICLQRSMQLFLVNPQACRLCHPCIYAQFRRLSLF